MIAKDRELPYWAHNKHTWYLTKPLVLVSNTHLTDCRECYLIAVETERHSLLGTILLPSQRLVTAKAAEVIQMPVMVLSTSILLTQDQL